MSGLTKTGMAIFLSVASIATAQSVVASQRYDSSIRQAAIERMQQKLGTLRGSIRPKARNVRLTDQIIDQLAPVGRETTSPSLPSDIDTPGSAGVDQTTTATAQPKKSFKKQKKSTFRSDDDLIKAVEAMLKED